MEIAVFQEQTESVIGFLHGEFSKIRTGRAHSALVEGLLVDAYGSKTPINQLATISVPEPRTIAIAPWDKSVLGAIEKSIRESDLGISPINDGQIIRVVLPTLTEESRKDIVKLVGKKAEEARIRLRNAREEMLRFIEKAEETGEISEDEKFRRRDAVQKIVDNQNKVIESLREEKEKEVMTV
jgi:ribosome recycling factor